MDSDIINLCRISSLLLETETYTEIDAWVMETNEYFVMMTLSRLNKGDMESEEDPLHHGAAQQEEPHADGGDHPDSVTSHVKPTCNVCGNLRGKIC